MKHEEFVSLWLGNTGSDEELENYVEFDYTDEDQVSSAFLTDFGIVPDDVDEDFFECSYTPECSDSISALLAGCSYEEEVIEAFREKIGDKL